MVKEENWLYWFGDIIIDEKREMFFDDERKVNEGTLEEVKSVNS